MITDIELTEFPDALKHIPQWLVWKSKEQPPKIDGTLIKNRKLPWDITSSRPLDSTNLELLRPYEEIAKAFSESPPGLYAGIGFQLSGTGWVCIDIDKGVMAGGEINPKALEVMSWFDGAYVETSPSGEGWHIWVKADKGDFKACKFNNFEGSGIDVEIYDTKRFLTVTGNFYGGCVDAERCRQSELQAFLSRAGGGAAAAGEATSTDYDGGAGGVSVLSDGDVVSMLKHSKNGQRFVDLFERGDSSEYDGDASSADMALANLLAFACNGDAAQMERLMMSSALYREKYEREDYLRERTIPAAISGTRERYTGKSQDAEQPAAVVELPFDDEFVGLDNDEYIGPREYIYKRRYAYGYLSITVAPGGVGKTTLSDIEAVSLAIGKDLFNERAPLKVGPQKVLVLSLEDDKSEFRRRHKSISSHYKLSAEENALVKRNIISIFRPTKLGTRPVKLLHQDGTKLIRDERGINRIFELIDKHAINVVTADPMAAISSIDENSNPAMNELMTIFTHIANVKRVAIHLNHHTRKGGDGSIDDARGASASIAAARSAYVLSKMSKEEAASFGVAEDERMRFVGMSDGKANHALLSGKKAWFYLATVCLQNETELFDADFLGVMEARDLEVAEAGGFKDDEVRRALLQISKSMPEHLRESVQATEWAGQVVGDVIGLKIPAGVAQKDLSNDAAIAKARVKSLLASMLGEGLIQLNKQGVRNPKGGFWTVYEISAAGLKQLKDTPAADDIEVPF